MRDLTLADFQGASSSTQTINNPSELFKALEPDFLKGGRPAQIGEIRDFGGRPYIKTANGWAFHGKGTGKKAQQHVTNQVSVNETPVNQSSQIQTAPIDHNKKVNLSNYDIKQQKAQNLKFTEALAPYIDKINKKYNTEHKAIFKDKDGSISGYNRDMVNDAYIKKYASKNVSSNRLSDYLSDIDSAFKQAHAQSPNLHQKNIDQVENDLIPKESKGLFHISFADHSNVMDDLEIANHNYKVPNAA
jgi:hypothetical protein